MHLSKISLSTNKDLYQIFVDNKFLCSISGNDLLETGLAVGDELSREKFTDLLYKSLKGKLSSSALRFLGSRPHSEDEIRQYLKRKLYTQVKETAEYKNLKTDQIVDEIISTLKSHNYINDDEFADWLIKQRTQSRNPKSKLAIRAELQAKGIDPNKINELLSEVTTELEGDKAKMIAEKKFQTLVNRHLEPRDLKIKLIRYLLSKGFSYETTQSAVDSILSPP